MTAVDEVQASQGAFNASTIAARRLLLLTSCGTAHAHAGVASIAFVLYDILLNLGDEVRREDTSATQRHSILKTAASEDRADLDVSRIAYLRWASSLNHRLAGLLTVG